jgi:hypothetical protein
MNLYFYGRRVSETKDVDQSNGNLHEHRSDKAVKNIYSIGSSGSFDSSFDC